MNWSRCVHTESSCTQRHLPRNIFFQRSSFWKGFSLCNSEMNALTLSPVDTPHKHSKSVPAILKHTVQWLHAEARKTHSRQQIVSYYHLFHLMGWTLDMTYFAVSGFIALFDVAKVRDHSMLHIQVNRAWIHAASPETSNMHSRERIPDITFVTSYSN